MTWWMNLKEELRYMIIIGSMIVLVSLGITFYLIMKPNKTQIKAEEFTPILKEEKKKNIHVDIKGAVVTPGVYELEEESIVKDAITKSGGLTPLADTTYINLSKRLKDEMVIIIYTKDEITAMKEGRENVIVLEGKCVCPNITNDGCIKEKDKIDNTGSNNKKESNGVINLNTATIEELQTLTGIGPSKAKDIVGYREKNGPFKTIEELTEVKGIGSATLEKIKDRISVS